MNAAPEAIARVASCIEAERRRARMAIVRSREGNRPDQRTSRNSIDPVERGHRIRPAADFGTIGPSVARNNKGRSVQASGLGIKITKGLIIALAVTAVWKVATAAPAPDRLSARLTYLVNPYGR